MTEHIAQESNAKVLNEIISEMSEPDREIFIRRYYYYEPIKQISELLELSAKTIENKLYRGKHKLKDTLTKRGIIL